MRISSQQNTKAILIVVMFFVGGMLFAGALSAAEFHINSEADVLAEADAEGYIGVSVSKVTEDLGSPSMVRNNLSDADQIDYIYIGESSVYAFAVMKELGKEVTASTKYGRPEWESSVYPLYPAKN